MLYVTNNNEAYSMPLLSGTGYSIVNLPFPIATIRKIITKL